jgi:hypothetical protein
MILLIALTAPTGAANRSEAVHELRVTALSALGNIEWETSATGGTIVVEASCNLASPSSWTECGRFPATAYVGAGRLDTCVSAAAYYRLRYAAPSAGVDPPPYVVIQAADQCSPIVNLRPFIERVWQESQPTPLSFTNNPGSPADVEDLQRAMAVIGKLDTDHDQMPDWWERWGELDPYDPSDAYEDADHDGLCNVCEYLRD